MLSIVIVTRNDDHGGHLLDRVRTFFRALAEYREMYGWDVEVVVVDWNPPPGTPKMHEATDVPDGFPARFFIVPPELHLQYSNSGVIPLFFQAGFNAGVRRAAGAWVLTSSQDLVFSDKLVRFLANENLSPHAVYRTTRFNTAARIVDGRTVDETVAELARQVTSARAFRDKQILHTRGCGDFILMHEYGWRLTRGYPEITLFGSYLDGLVLHSAYVAGLMQVALDPTRCTYHLLHGGQTEERLADTEMPVMDYVTIYGSLCREMLRSMEPLMLNDENWGLADCDDKQVADNCWKIMPRSQYVRGVGLPECLTFPARGE